MTKSHLLGALYLVLSALLSSQPATAALLKFSLHDPGDAEMQFLLDTSAVTLDSYGDVSVTSIRFSGGVTDFSLNVTGFDQFNSLTDYTWAGSLGHENSEYDLSSIFYLSGGYRFVMSRQCCFRWTAITREEWGNSTDPLSDFFLSSAEQGEFHVGWALFDPGDEPPVATGGFSQSLSVTLVPIPPAVWLLATGLAGLGGRRWLRRNRSRRVSSFGPAANRGILRGGDLT